MDPMVITFRWFHIVAAIIAIGGAVFLRVALLPGMAALPENDLATLRATGMRRWVLVLPSCILISLFSGLYNYIWVTRPRHAGQPLYDALIGTKIFLAFIVFAIAEGLVGKAPPFEFMRRSPGLWLSINILLAAVI